MIIYNPIESEVWVLTAEGREMADTGSYEVKVFEAIPPGETGISISELQV
jgi:hypothetical protein